MRVFFAVPEAGLSWQKCTLNSRSAVPANRIVWLLIAEIAEIKILRIRHSPAIFADKMLGAIKNRDISWFSNHVFEKIEKLVSNFTNLYGNTGEAHVKCD